MDIYRHYKGGLYALDCFADRHTHDEEKDVIYISLKYGKRYSRPLNRDSRNEDSWHDLVKWPDGITRQRFTLAAAIPEKELRVLKTLWLDER